ncbi:MAG TPA: hypothetical protein PK812_06620 [Beijerinckiaceae bacterium]|nr:hypothetical protein [Beijerinckiaceae bacterium]
MEHKTERFPESPAADAAGLLLRLGFGLLVMVAPVSALFSRRAFIVLVPVGALLIVAAALLRDSGGLSHRLRDAVLSPTGMAALGLGIWCALSLAWTPFPGPAAERLLRTLGIGVLALAVVSALPQRMRASNLHLMSIGVAAATLALIVAAVLGPSALRFLRDLETPTIGRAAAAAGVMVWPAVAWTMTRGRDGQAFSLIAVCGVAIAASGSLDAAVVMILALAVFLAARTMPTTTGRMLSIAFPAAVLAAPILAFAARFLARAMRLRADHDLTEIGHWADAIAAQPIRLITGHGFDTALRARLAGLVDPRAPGGLISDTWYDLGLIGATGLALVLWLMFRTLAGLAQPVAATALAVATAIAAFAIIDPTALQVWWLCVMLVAALMLAAVESGQYRTTRPAALVQQGGPRRPVARIGR